MTSDEPSVTVIESRARHQLHLCGHPRATVIRVDSHAILFIEDNRAFTAWKTTDVSTTASRGAVSLTIEPGFVASH